MEVIWKNATLCHLVHRFSGIWADLGYGGPTAGQSARQAAVAAAQPNTRGHKRTNVKLKTMNKCAGDKWQALSQFPCGEIAHRMLMLCAVMRIALCMYGCCCRYSETIVL